MALWRSLAGISVRMVERRAGVNAAMEVGKRRRVSSETRVELIPGTEEICVRERRRGEEGRRG